MGQAIGDLLPSAIGVALSPVPIIAVILILGTPKARSNGPAFAVGWVLGLVIVSVIVLLVAGGSDDPDSGSSTAVDVIKLLIGVLFLVLALKQWQGRPQPGEEADDADVDGHGRRVRAGQVARARRRAVGCQPEEPRARRWPPRRRSPRPGSTAARAPSPSPCSSCSVR